MPIMVDVQPMAAAMWLDMSNSSSNLLRLRAGKTALATLRAEGFSPDLFSTVVGASGGPKWLVLSQLDRVLVEDWIEPGRTALDFVGSSIGSFRHACLAQSDPRAAIERFEASYIAQAYDSRPGGAEVSAQSVRILDILMGDRGRAEVIANPRLRNHVIAARMRVPVGLYLSLGLAALGNLVSRGTLGWFFERALFSTPRTGAVLEFDRFPTARIELSERNLDRAILASGTIPFVMDGIRDIEGAAPGLYLDGGLLDYHFDFEFRGPPGLVLYPHFFEHITPGWLDKNLQWRRVRGAALDRVLMISPSAEFVKGLPGGRVPDRSDFERMPTEERQAQWWRVVRACGALAEQLHEWVATGRIVEAIEPFGPPD